MPACSSASTSAATWSRPAPSRNALRRRGAGGRPHALAARPGRADRRLAVARRGSRAGLRVAGRLGRRRRPARGGGALIATARSTACRSASGRRGHMPTKAAGMRRNLERSTCGRSRSSPSRCCPAPASNASSSPRRPAFAGTRFAGPDLQLQPKGLSPMNDIHAAETKALGRSTAACLRRLHARLRGVQGGQ